LVVSDLIPSININHQATNARITILYQCVIRKHTIINIDTHKSYKYSRNYIFNMLKIINPATSCSRRRKRPTTEMTISKYHQKIVTLPTTAHMIGLLQVVLCIIIGGDARLLCHSFQIPSYTSSSVAKCDHRRQYYSSSSSSSSKSKTKTTPTETTTTTTCLNALHLLNFEALESSFTHIATLPDTLDFIPTYPTYADVQSLVPKLPELPFNKLADQLRNELGT
jgi:hypothetical protein